MFQENIDDLCVHFPYNLREKTALANDTVTDKNIQFFSKISTGYSYSQNFVFFFYRYKHNYIPHRDFWVNCFYFEISNSTQKQFLTIDTEDVNDLGPAKFRTQANSDTEQIFYYNRSKRDTSFISFLAVRKETPSASKITFSIVKIIDKPNRHDTIYSEISDK